MFEGTCCECGCMFGNGGEWRPNIKCKSCDFYVCHYCWVSEDGYKPVDTYWDNCLFNDIYDRIEERHYEYYSLLTKDEEKMSEKDFEENIKGYCVKCYNIKELEEENKKLKILLIQQKCNNYILKSIYNFL